MKDWYDTKEAMGVMEFMERGDYKISGKEWWGRFQAWYDANGRGPFSGWDELSREDYSYRMKVVQDYKFYREWFIRNSIVPHAVTWDGGVVGGSRK